MRPMEGTMKRGWGMINAVCGIAACGLLTLSGASAQDWTMGGQNLSDWRNQPATGINPQNVAGLKPKWTFTTGGDVTATPAVSNGIVYFPDFAGNYYAVNAKTGALIWKRLVGDWTGVAGDYARNDPAVQNGTLFLGNQAGNNAFYNFNTGSFSGGGAWVVAVDANSGNLKWKRQVEAFPTAIVTSSPVIHKGVLYVGVASAEEASAIVQLTSSGPITPCCVS